MLNLKAADVCVRPFLILMSNFGILFSEMEKALLCFIETSTESSWCLHSELLQ